MQAGRGGQGEGEAGSSERKSKDSKPASRRRYHRASRLQYSRAFVGSSGVCVRDAENESICYL